MFEQRFFRYLDTVTQIVVLYAYHRLFLSFLRQEIYFLYIRTVDHPRIFEQTSL